MPKAKAKGKANVKDPRTLHKHVWLWADAMQVVRLLQEALWPLKYHVTLGGGVLNVGYSDKDLDIFVLPFNNDTPADSGKLRSALESVLTYSRPIGQPDKYGYVHEIHAAKDVWLFDGKRVDVFIVRMQAPAAGQGADAEEEL
jgi:hypothetical protein